MPLDPQIRTELEKSLNTPQAQELLIEALLEPSMRVQVRTVLMRFFKKSSDIELICTDVGIETGRIQFAKSAEELWSDVLTELSRCESKTQIRFLLEVLDRAPAALNPLTKLLLPEQGHLELQRLERLAAHEAAPPILPSRSPPPSAGVVEAEKRGGAQSPVPSDTAPPSGAFPPATIKSRGRVQHLWWGIGAVALIGLLQGILRIVPLREEAMDTRTPEGMLLNQTPAAAPVEDCASFDQLRLTVLEIDRKVFVPPPGQAPRAWQKAEFNTGDVPLAALERFLEEGLEGILAWLKPRAVFFDFSLSSSLPEPRVLSRGEHASTVADARPLSGGLEAPIPWYVRRPSPGLSSRLAVTEMLPIMRSERDGIAEACVDSEATLGGWLAVVARNGGELPPGARVGCLEVRCKVPTPPPGHETAHWPFFQHAVSVLLADPQARAIELESPGTVVLIGISAPVAGRLTPSSHPDESTVLRCGAGCLEASSWPETQREAWVAAGLAGLFVAR